MWPHESVSTYSFAQISNRLSTTTRMECRFRGLLGVVRLVVMGDFSNSTRAYRHGLSFYPKVFSAHGTLSIPACKPTRVESPNLSTSGSLVLAEHVHANVNSQFPNRSLSSSLHSNLVGVRSLRGVGIGTSEHSRFQRRRSISIVMLCGSAPHPAFRGG